jgi:hypothetical protein
MASGTWTLDCIRSLRAINNWDDDSVRVLLDGLEEVVREREHAAQALAEATQVALEACDSADENASLVHLAMETGLAECERWRDLYERGVKHQQWMELVKDSITRERNNLRDEVEQLRGAARLNDAAWQDTYAKACRDLKSTRAELARVREAGSAVLKAHDDVSWERFPRSLDLLRAALGGGA